MALGDGRRGAQRQPQRLPPHLGAFGRIEPDHVARAQGREQPAVSVGETAADQAIGVVLLELPDGRAAAGVECPDRRLAIHGEHATISDHRSGQQLPRPASPRRCWSARPDRAGRRRRDDSMTWLGLPPFCGQAALSCGGGSWMADWRGSAFTSRSSSITDTRSPGSGGSSEAPNQLSSLEQAASPINAARAQRLRPISRPPRPLLPALEPTRAVLVPRLPAASSLRRRLLRCVGGPPRNASSSAARRPR